MLHPAIVVARQRLRRLPLAHRRDDGHGGRRLGADHVAQQRDRAGVGPVQILDEHEDRGRSRGRREQLGDGLEHRALVALGIGAQARNGSDELGQNRQQPGEVGRPAAELRAQPSRRQGNDEPPDRFRDRLERCGDPLVAAAVQHDRASGMGLAGELRQQACLADPGRPGDERHPSLAGGRGAPQIPQLLELVLAPDEDADPAQVLDELDLRRLEIIDAAVGGAVPLDRADGDLVCQPAQRHAAELAHDPVVGSGSSDEAIRREDLVRLRHVAQPARDDDRRAPVVALVRDRRPVVQADAHQQAAVFGKLLSGDGDLHRDRACQPVGGSPERGHDPVADVLDLVP